jgi:hypothetical protein
VLKLTNESVTTRPGEEMVTEQVEEICATPSPVPPDIIPLNADSVASDAEQIEYAEASLETEYDAMNPEAGIDSSDVNVTFIIPVSEDTELGRAVPLNGLPTSSVIELQGLVVQEYSRTRSRPSCVLKLANERVTLLPGEEMTTKQAALLL